MKELICSLVESGLTVDGLMKETGLKKVAVLRFCGEFGVMDRLRTNARKPRAPRDASDCRARGHARKVSDEVLAEMVAAGKRPKQIAIECGISTQAVYQRLRGAAIQVPPKPVKVKMSAIWGIPLERAKMLKSVGATPAYIQQRQNAKNRGIGWELTLDQWWAIWEQSGKWEQRGKFKGGYVMGRPGNLGPYAVGNVVVCSHRENVLEREKHSPSFGRLQKRQETRLDTR